jgi:hypothetical protein
MAGSDLDAKRIACTFGKWWDFVQRFAASQHDFENGEVRAFVQFKEGHRTNFETRNGRVHSEYTMQKSDGIQGSAAEQIWNTRWNRIHSKTTTLKSEKHVIPPPVYNYYTEIYNATLHMFLFFSHLLKEPAETRKLHPPYTHKLNYISVQKNKTTSLIKNQHPQNLINVMDKI